MSVHSTKKTVAVIGSGVSGLVSAHYLSQHGFEVELFEADSRFGGHVNTVTVDDCGTPLPIDTGFIVCNKKTYPNFFRLLGELGVGLNLSEMSFSVVNPSLNLEYNGHNLNTLFAQRSNLLRPKFYQLVKQILRFNQEVSELLESPDQLIRYKYVTLGDYLAQKNYDNWFSQNYLIPMVAAIWSMGLNEARQFPLIFFAKFFANHGLLKIKDRPQWYTVKGGAKSYVTALLHQFKGKTHLNTPVLGVTQHDAQSKVQVDYQHQANTAQTKDFDHVVFACHADTALALLQNPTTNQSSVLSKFEFTQNTAVLHTDLSLMPKRKRCYASWNYRINSNSSLPVLTYHMNQLQKFSSSTHYLVSLNQEVDPAKVLYQTNYSHPVYNHSMTEAQQLWDQACTPNVLFAGAYWFNGFHEDGVRSAVRVCQTLGVDLPDLLESK